MRCRALALLVRPCRMRRLPWRSSGADDHGHASGCGERHERGGAAGVAITVRSADTGVTRTAVTDATGGSTSPPSRSDGTT